MHVTGEVEDVKDLVRDLIREAEDVRVVLCEPTNSEES
jgi:hypothetical protein